MGKMEKRQIELIIIIKVRRSECKRTISEIEYNAPSNLMLENAPNQMHTQADTNTARHQIDYKIC